MWQNRKRLQHQEYFNKSYFLREVARLKKNKNYSLTHSYLFEKPNKPVYNKYNYNSLQYVTIRRVPVARGLLRATRPCTDLFSAGFFGRVLGVCMQIAMTRDAKIFKVAMIS